MQSAVYHQIHKRVSELFQSSSECCAHHLNKISAAFGTHSGYSTNQKYYHAAKLLGMSGLFLVSAFTLNVEGVIGGGFAVGDEVLKVEEVGEAAIKPPSKPTTLTV